MIDCSKKPGKVFGGGCLVVAERALYFLWADNAIGPTIISFILTATIVTMIAFL